VFRIHIAGGDDMLDGFIKSEYLRLVLLSLFALTITISAASSDSGNWTYTGDAYLDRASGDVVLTQNKNGQVGGIWLKDIINGPFKASFNYKAGGGAGADGLVFMFYKNYRYDQPGGGSLGFGDGGYGIEFDSWSNQPQNDPQGKHIALIRDRTSNHLAYTLFNGVNDNLWHHVVVDVNNGQVTVDVDGRRMLTQSGINQIYGSIGFAAATGGANDWHRIDKIEIDYYVITYISTGGGKGETIGETKPVKKKKKVRDSF
jgi:hypothetical protein